MSLSSRCLFPAVVGPQWAEKVIMPAWPWCFAALLKPDSFSASGGVVILIKEDTGGSGPQSSSPALHFPSHFCAVARRKFHQFPPAPPVDMPQRLLLRGVCETDWHNLTSCWDVNMCCREACCFTMEVLFYCLFSLILFYIHISSLEAETLNVFRADESVMWQKV